MLLELNGIDVDCIIGELPEERVKTQRITVDVRLDICDKSASSDDLRDTVDYATLTGAVRAALVSAECRMIERAAKVVYDLCIALPGVRRASARVTKTGAIPHLVSASAVFDGCESV